MVSTTDFVINSDYPMPAQTGVVSAAITIPAGASELSEYTTSMPIGTANIFRPSFTSTLAGKTFVGGDVVFYVASNGDKYIVVVGTAAGGSVIVRAFPFSTTQSAETIKISLSCFILP